MIEKKNIVLCSDGTGSSGYQKRGTNVYKLFEAVDLHGHKKDPDLPKQIAFYDDGVGTATAKWRKILGSAFGLGLSKNVKELYADLVRTYNAGDRIYLFGFSRGAFTVRTLAGLINTYGIIDRRHLEDDKELSEKVDKLYEQYRRKYDAYISPYVHRLRDKYYASDKEIETIKNTPIQFIGVWDTVDAVGFPIKWVADKMNKYIYRFKFKDRKLSSKKKVKKACHALSIDDERLTFHPLLWDEEEEDKKDRRIEQVWFAGVHSNVGGGYSKHGMSLVSLDWMMTKAEQAGLKLDKDKLMPNDPYRLRFIDPDRNLYYHRRNVTDKLYDPRSGMAVYYRYKPRNISRMCRKNHFKPRIHDSVIDRIMQRTEGYAPGNIPFDSEFVSTENVCEDNDKSKKTFCKLYYKDDDKEKSLLDRDNIKRLVSKRCKSHRVFLITSIITILFIVGITLVANIPHFSFTSIVGTLFKLTSMTGLIQLFKGLLAKQLLFIIAVIAPIIVPIGFYLIIRRLKQEMNEYFSEFWYKFLKDVDKIMKASGKVVDEKSGESD